MFFTFSWITAAAANILVGNTFLGFGMAVCGLTADLVFSALEARRANRELES